MDDLTQSRSPLQTTTMPFAQWVTASRVYKPGMLRIVAVLGFQVSLSTWGGPAFLHLPLRAVRTSPCAASQTSLGEAKSAGELALAASFVYVNRQPCLLSTGIIGGCVMKCLFCRPPSASRDARSFSIWDHTYFFPLNFHQA